MGVHLDKEGFFSTPAWLAPKRILGGWWMEESVPSYFVYRLSDWFLHMDLADGVCAFCFIVFVKVVELTDGPVEGRSGGNGAGEAVYEAPPRSTT